MKAKANKTATPKKCVAKKPAKCNAGKKSAAKKPTTTKTTRKTVVFTFHAEKGKNICLAGEFNEWDPAGKRLTYDAKRGLYSASLKLATGSYQYKFVVDGIWCIDPENEAFTPNDQGTFNSVITVK